MVLLQCNGGGKVTCMKFKQVHIFPGMQYWIKIDGTDIEPAIMAIVRREWLGDVDIWDGQLQHLRAIDYVRIATIKPFTNVAPCIVVNSWVCVISCIQV